VSGRSLLPRRSLLSTLREADALRRRSERHPALFWSRRVNRRIGAIIALLLLRTSVTPNEVSIAGLVVNVLGAAFVLVAPTPAPVPVVLLVFLTWQLALSLDCADGQLARARGTSAPFGAWLDQILDFVTHTAVTGSLVLFAVRGLGLNSVEAATLATLTLSASLVGLFASAQRNALLGTLPAMDARAHARIRLLLLGRHLTDYGAFLAVWSIGLAWPPLLLASLVLAAILFAASVIAQVTVNWPRAGRAGLVVRQADPQLVEDAPQLAAADWRHPPRDEVRTQLGQTPGSEQLTPVDRTGEGPRPDEGPGLEALR
jgi:phosphatidylglycerophosphate synthase